MWLLLFKLFVVDEIVWMVWLYVEVGWLKFVIDSVFLLSDVVGVYVWMDVGDYVGKIVLEV